MTTPYLLTNDPHHDHGPDEDDRHDRGLQFDLQTMAERDRETIASGADDGVRFDSTSDGGGRSFNRRRALGLFGAGAASMALAACKLEVQGGGYSILPEETAGPYPGDGSNGPNVLTQSGVVRSDIRSSFGSMSGTAAGVPLTIDMFLVDASDGYETKKGLAVYLWHCNAAGGYSLYSSGLTNQNYLRGVQVTDDLGHVRFTSIFPACYSGRWPHIHFEVYPTLSSITSASNKIATSQMALPAAACNTVYSSNSLYSTSVSRLKQVSLSTDGVFGNDQAAHQIATVSGDASSMSLSFIGAVA